MPRSVWAIERERRVSDDRDEVREVKRGRSPPSCGRYVWTSLSCSFKLYMSIFFITLVLGLGGSVRPGGGARPPYSGRRPPQPRRPRRNRVAVAASASISLPMEPPCSGSAARARASTTRITSRAPEVLFDSHLAGRSLVGYARCMRRLLPLLLLISISEIRPIRRARTRAIPVRNPSRIGNRLLLICSISGSSRAVEGPRRSR
jgi:hypothetical protein